MSEPSARSPFALTLSPQVGRRYVSFLRRHLRAARKLLPQSRLNELSVVIVNAKTMSQLHADFLNIPTPTDVLTFELEVDAKRRPTSGEVYICLDVATENARRRKIRLQNELLLYALHGLLHLSGFDDISATHYRTMHAKEDQILTQLGIGQVFAPQLRPK